MSSTFRFENPAALQILWVIPILIFIALSIARLHGRRLKNIFSEKLFPFLTASVSVTRRRWKLILECLVLFCFIVALARPQSGQSQQKVKSEGVELMLLFDVSQSMLAEDIKPSRLEFAKKEAVRFLDSGGDRVGIIAFAGTGVLLSPMTSDKNALKMYIESLTTDSVSTQGTEFRKALLEASEALKRGGIEGDELTRVTRAVVILSDGEDNEAGAVEAAKSLHEQGVRIFALAVGTEKGGAIPIRDSGGNLRGYRKNKSGQVVLTQTKGTLLKELAQVGGGSFYHLTYGGKALENLRNDLNRLERAEFDSAMVINYDEKFQMILFLGIILALIELVLGERRSTGRIWRGRFEVTQS